MGRAILIAESLLALFHRGNSARANHRNDHLYSVCFSRYAADKATIVGPSNGCLSGFRSGGRLA